MSCKHHLVLTGDNWQDREWYCKHCQESRPAHMHPSFAGASYYGMVLKKCKLCGKEYIFKMYISHGELRIEMWWDDDEKRFKIRDSEKSFENAVDAIQYICGGEYEEEVSKAV